MKNKSVHNCQFVHHANFHCIMTTLNKVFKNEFEGGETGKEPNSLVVFFIKKTHSGLRNYACNAKIKFGV